MFKWLRHLGRRAGEALHLISPKQGPQRTDDNQPPTIELGKGETGTGEPGEVTTEQLVRLLHQWRQRAPQQVPGLNQFSNEDLIHIVTAGTEKGFDDARYWNAQLSHAFQKYPILFEHFREFENRLLEENQGVYPPATPALTRGDTNEDFIRHYANLMSVGQAFNSVSDLVKNGLYPEDGELLSADYGPELSLLDDLLSPNSDEKGDITSVLGLLKIVMRHKYGMDDTERAISLRATQLLNDQPKDPGTFLMELASYYLDQPPEFLIQKRQKAYEHLEADDAETYRIMNQAMQGDE